MRLEGKVAVMTGASRGPGEHLSLELAAQGARAVSAARNGELDASPGRVEKTSPVCSVSARS
jgi:NAD(P)-dependent dehydrogenase (short-subunit alcohol dehydrogenase family)